MLLYVILGIIGLLAIIAFIPIRFGIRYEKKNVEEWLRIGFFKLELNKKEKKEKAIQKESDEVQNSEKPKQSLTSKIKKGINIYNNNAEDIKGVVGYVAKKAIIFDDIDVNFEYGTDNPATTGILYGVINGIVYGILGVIANSIKVKKQNIIISPDFNSAKIEIGAGCIVKLKNVHIIIAGIKCLKLWNKIKKSRKESENNGRISD